MTAVMDELRSQSVPMSSFPNRPRSLPPSPPLPAQASYRNLRASFYFPLHAFSWLVTGLWFHWPYLHRPYENCPVLMVCAPDAHRVGPIWRAVHHRRGIRRDQGVQYATTHFHDCSRSTVGDWCTGGTRLEHCYSGTSAALHGPKFTICTRGFCNRLCRRLRT